MRDLFVILLIVFSVLIFTMLATAFIIWSFDFSSLKHGGRFLMIFFWTTLSALFTAMYLDLK